MIPDSFSKGSSTPPVPPSTPKKSASKVPGAFTTYQAQGNREDLAPRRVKRKRKKSA
jgi:hypothetical protein